MMDGRGFRARPSCCNVRQRFAAVTLNEFDPEVVPRAMNMKQKPAVSVASVDSSRMISLWMVFILAIWSSGSQAHPAGSHSLAPMLDRVTPGVVNISTTATVKPQSHPYYGDPFFRWFFGNRPQQPRQQPNEQSRPNSLGSGVIVDAQKGYVLTNHHVIAGADEITVTLKDGRNFKAELVGSDPKSDVAVIKIEPDNLSAVPLGDSTKIRVGDYVVAIGNPFGLGQTVTSGIIGAIGRTGLGIEEYEDFIQTDAPINPGNSGGALVSLDGKLIGINTAIQTPSGGNVGIGFAIPINMANQLTLQLVQYGKVRRGQLGVHIQDMTKEIAKAMDSDIDSGAIVTAVMPDSAAEKAGVERGDIIVELNGRKIESAADLKNAIGVLGIGEDLDIRLIRDGRKKRISASVGEPAAADDWEGGKLGEFLQGVKLREAEREDDWGNKISGIAVVDVASGSPAWRAGLRPKDVILEVNQQPVSKLGQLKDAVDSQDSRVLLLIERGPQRFYVVMQ